MGRGERLHRIYSRPNWAFDGGRGWRFQLAAVQPAFFDQLGDGLELEQMPRGQRHTGFVGTSNGLDHMNGISSKFKKVIVDPDFFKVQYAFPKAHEQLLHFRLWWNKIFSETRALVIGNRQRLPVNFSIRSQWH